MPEAAASGLPAYMASKLALSGLIESAEAEQQQQRTFAVAVHTGMVADTAIFHEVGCEGRPASCPVDAMCLPAYFLVWMARPEARSLRGRTVGVDWAVDEFNAPEKETLRADSGRFTNDVYGWLFFAIRGGGACASRVLILEYVGLVFSL